jgi:phosphoglucosamine mutase
MMQEKGINFGGEQSGHVIFSDYAKTGDGISSALQALSYLVSTGQKASEAFDPYTSYPQLLVNLPISKKPAIESITGIETLQTEVESSGMRHLFRYSGTENLIRILLEGKDAVKLEQMMEKCLTFFQSELS